MKIPRWWAAVLVCVLASGADATSYYVDASGGDDAKDGQSIATAWKSIAKVNGSSFAPGDQILLKRGEIWHESLIPPSSGASGSPIVFDAYGAGDAPTITGYQNIPSSSWTLDSGNIWKASITSVSFNYILFGGSLWGLKHTTGKSACVAPYDFYFASNVLYVYSAGNPGTYYGSVAAMLMSNGQLIYVNGKSWLQFQHLRLTYFDAYGFRVGGASDHITVANMEAQGIIPAGALPHGFYVNASPNPTDINFYNVEAHRNYDGFRFDGGASAIILKNCKAYANRDRGIQDNTNAANYAYCQFYANGLAQLVSTDVAGGIDGGNNITGYVWPAVTGFQRYPSRITLTIDDPGLVSGEDSYVDSMLPVFDSRGLKLSIAVVTGYANSILPKIQSWFNDGQDIDAHSWSHQYFTNTNAFTIQYTGMGTAATLTIAGNVLSTNVTGGPGGENLSLNLANASYSSISALVATINGRGVYTAVQDGSCQGAVHSIALGDIAGQAIKASSYTTQLQKDRLIPDELSSAKSWLQSNVTGLTNEKTYVYPDGMEDSQTQGWAAAAGYEGSRGGLAMNTGAKEVYGLGVNIQDITSLSISTLHNLTQAQITNEVQAAVFKSAVWGVPYGLFYHNQELTTSEVGYVLDALTQNGATVMTNTQLMDWLHGASNIAGTNNYISAATGGDANFSPTPSSPVVNAGTSMGSNYKYDLIGVDQTWMGSGWEMGAYALVPQSTYLIVVH